MFTRLIAVAVVFGLSLPGMLLAGKAGEMRPGTVLYKIKEEASPSQLKMFNALLHQRGIVNERILEKLGVHVTELNIRGEEKAFSEALKATGAVIFAEPDYLMAPVQAPNDQYYMLQWHHETINSEGAWDHTTGEATVLVAVCDTGVEETHPDLVDNLVLPGYNAVDGSDNTADIQGHGTSTIGTVGAVGDNIIGVAGVNWTVSIVPVRVSNLPTGNAYLSDMANGVRWAADAGAKAVNLSYGGAGSDTINEAALYLRERGGLLFMSAGNGGALQSYSDFSSFVVVAATNDLDEKADFSDWGAYVDVTAPGVSIPTTGTDAGYVYASGTSFSSPMTAGVAALLFAANPDLTPSQIETILFDTAVDLGDPGDDIVFGHGRIDAQAAVLAALGSISNTSPVAVATAAPLSGNAPLEVFFESNGSYDTDGSIVSYSWDFGDGNSANGANTVHTYTQTGSYSATLTVTDNLGATASDTVDVTVDPAPYVLNTPSNLTAAVDGNTVTLAWSDNAVNEEGYYIERAMKIRGKYAFEQIAIVNAESTGFTDSNVAIGNYKYRVRAFNGSAVSDYSNEAAAQVETVVVDPPVPGTLAAPSDLTAQLNGVSVTLQWSDNSSDEEGFYVERGLKVRNSTTYSVIGTTTAAAYQDTLPGKGTYLYRVQAYKADERSDYSNTVSVRLK